MRVLKEEDIKKNRLRDKDGKRLYPLRKKKESVSEEGGNVLNDIAETLKEISKESNENIKDILVSMADMISEISERKIVVEIPDSIGTAWKTIDATVEERDFNNNIKKIRIRRVK